MDTPYTATDVALILGFTPKTIREWCSRGKFPGAQKFPDDSPRSEWRIPRDAVEAIQRREASAPVTRDRLEQLMDAALARSSRKGFR